MAIVTLIESKQVDAISAPIADYIRAKYQSDFKKFARDANLTRNRAEQLLRPQHKWALETAIIIAAQLELKIGIIG